MKARAAYAAQKAGAKRRGIEFNLTFKQWCDFWDADIDKRGVGHDKLQMQRIADTGPYEIGNIRKGCSKQNTATMLKMRAKRNCEKAATALQRALDAAMWQESAPPPDEESSKEMRQLGMGSSYYARFSYVG